jgi:lipopolysaccharide biosynthesis glycosyltransferase
VYEKNNKSFELEFYRKRGILKNIYFNAGILILNLDKIRKQYDLLQQGMDFLLKYPEAPYLDQDALNYIFQNDCIFLTDKYNKSVRYAFADGTSKYNNEAEWQNICWHFYTAAKPWIISKYPVSDLYWRYFYKTPWGKDINNFIKYYKKVVPFLDDGLQYQPIGRRRYFIMAFIKRLRAEFKKKYDL